MTLWRQLQESESEKVEYFRIMTCGLLVKWLTKHKQRRMAAVGIQPSLANSSRERESDKVEYVMIDHDLWSWVMWFFVGPSLWQSLPSLGKDSSLPPTPINQKLNRYLNSNSPFLWFTKTYHGTWQSVGKNRTISAWDWTFSIKQYLPNKTIPAWDWM